MSNNSPIDQPTLNGLYEAVGGDPDFMNELLEEYFNDAPAQFDAMKQALAAGDAETFRRAAHTMKSNSANFGAKKLSGMCKELEDLGKEGEIAGTGDLIKKANAEYAEVKAALEAAVKEMS